MLFYLLVLPALALALVAYAAVSRRFGSRSRWAALVASVAIACAALTIVRTTGVRGGGFEFQWRWTPTPEERLLALGRPDEEPPPALEPPPDRFLDSGRGEPAAEEPTPGAVADPEQEEGGALPKPAEARARPEPPAAAPAPESPAAPACRSGFRAPRTTTSRAPPAVARAPPGEMRSSRSRSARRR